MKKNSALSMLETLHKHMCVIKQTNYVGGFLAAAKSEPHTIVAYDADEAEELRKGHELPKSTVYVSVNSLKGIRGHSRPVLLTPRAQDKLFELALDDLHTLQVVREAVE